MNPTTTPAPPPLTRGAVAEPVPAPPLGTVFTGEEGLVVQLLQQVGKGTFATVFSAEEQETKLKVAAKVRGGRAGGEGGCWGWAHPPRCRFL